MLCVQFSLGCLLENPQLALSQFLTDKGSKFVHSQGADEKDEVKNKEYLYFESTVSVAWYVFTKLL